MRKRRFVAICAAVGAELLWAQAMRCCAAEWSMTPVYSASADYDSNRTLSPEPEGSEAGVLTADLRFKRALENSAIIIEPRYALRRFSRSTLGNGDDRSLFAEYDGNRERDTLAINGSYWDQSTLYTEYLETGIAAANTHRRLGQANLNWTRSHTERWQLVLQLSYQDVSYNGAAAYLLPGYRYPVANLGERFTFSERCSLTLGGYGSQLSSHSVGNTSHEYGVRAELIYSFSERTRFDAWIGESERVLAAQRGLGTDANLTLTHDMSATTFSLNYSRTLVPYGTGFLVEQQQGLLNAIWHMTPLLDVNLTVQHLQNNRVAVLLDLDHPRYDNVTGGLTWHVRETWSVGATLTGVRTETPGFIQRQVHQWRTGLNVTWTPVPLARSW